MMEPFLGRIVALVEQGRVPDPVVRFGIRQLCRQRLRVEKRGTAAGRERARAAFADGMREGPVAPVPHLPNEQHYELPLAFFSRVLGPNLKYSCGYWMHGARSLAEAEQASLAVTCQRAGLADGMDVLDLGCGWGSLTLWMAQHYPNSRITAVSNSVSQQAFIEGRAGDSGFAHVRAITADMNAFEPDGSFDRIVSVEMFEHMRNYEALLARIAGWLRPGGELFVHVFSHRSLSYVFETEGAGNWMGRHFFTGGIMPSHDLLLEFQRDVELVERWRWNGRHYQRTANAWLANLDRSRVEILPVLAGVYGRADAERWLVRWRLFFMAVAEQFGYRRGSEWGVSHYLFRPRPR
jgi:cyclopropane-fatty-acyl-phospholipid synthase